jgi:hypothetical protein
MHNCSAVSWEQGELFGALKQQDCSNEYQVEHCTAPTPATKHPQISLSSPAVWQAGRLSINNPYLRMTLICLQNPEVKNADGNTPMHWACLNGHAEV